MFEIFRDHFVMKLALSVWISFQFKFSQSTTSINVLRLYKIDFTRSIECSLNRDYFTRCYWFKLVKLWRSVFRICDSVEFILLYLEFLILLLACCAIWSLMMKLISLFDWKNVAIIFFFAQSKLMKLKLQDFM